MLRVLVFVTLIAWIHAGDGGFAPFCKEFLEGTLYDGGGNEMTCTKEFTLENVRTESAQALCQYRSRFAVLTADVDGNKLTCKWKITGTCGDGHYINRYCYTFSSSCTGGWELLPLTDGQAFRWTILTFAGDYQYVVKVKLPKNYTEPSLKYSWGRLLPLAAGETLTEKAVVFHRMSAFGSHPGDIVYLQEGKEEHPVYSICRTRAFRDSQIVGAGSIGLGGVAGSDSAKHGSGATGSLTIEAVDKKFTLMLTRNVYSPKLDSKGDVNVTYFHNVCETLCDNCYAATPDYLDSTKLASKFVKGKFWLPGKRSIASTKTNCGDNKRDPDSEIRKWMVLYHKRHRGTAVLKDTYWKTGLPNRLCSDQGRSAMAYQDGKAIDVPIFDRLPLVCVQGGDPPVPESLNSCYKNSESDGNGGCKCNAGFKDVKDDKSWEHQKGDDTVRKYVSDNLKVEKGSVCVLDTCKSEEKRTDPPFHSILFVIDGSSSIGTSNFDDMRDFLRKGKSWLPRKPRIFFIQYGCNTNKIYKTQSNWIDADYDKAVTDSVGDYNIGGTPTYRAIQDMTNDWLGTNPLPRQAIMIIITDGDPNDADNKQQIISNARNNGITIKYVAVGGRTSSMREDVLSEQDDIVDMANYETLKNTLQSSLQRILNCAPISREEVDEAADRAYE